VNQVESGMMEFEEIKFNLWELLEASVELAYVNCKHKGVELFLDVGGEHHLSYARF
jgi:hypothetical protein